MDELSVVIPTIGRPERLRRALERLDAQTALGRFEVIVVADAAAARGDAGAGCARHRYPTRLLTASVPGAAGARNAGWRATETPLILFIDDDILAEPELVAQHLAWHRDHGELEVGVLGDVRWASELRVTTFMRWLEQGIQFDYAAIDGIEAGWGRFYTANVSVKRAMLERVHGFDERGFPFGHEDLDLAYRMSKEGFRLLYNRRARAEHLHPMDLEFWRQRVRRIAASERRFLSRHPEIPPYFHDLLADHVDVPAPRGWGERLARIVPPWVPLIGPRAWRSADAVYRHQLAPPFIEAWERAGELGPGTPGLSEREVR